MEQNSGADQVNNAIQQLNQITQQNASASEEMATSSEELASQAQQLLEMIAFFRLRNGETKSKGNMTAEKIRSGYNAGKPAISDKGFPRDNDYSRGAHKGITLNMGINNLDSNYEKF